MKKAATTEGESPSRLIDARIRELDDWRGRTLSHVRSHVAQRTPGTCYEKSRTIVQLFCCAPLFPSNSGRSLLSSPRALSGRRHGLVIVRVMQASWKGTKVPPMREEAEGKAPRSFSTVPVDRYPNQ